MLLSTVIPNTTSVFEAIHIQLQIDERVEKVYFMKSCLIEVFFKDIGLNVTYFDKHDGTLLYVVFQQLEHLYMFYIICFDHSSMLRSGINVHYDLIRRTYCTTSLV